MEEGTPPSMARWNAPARRRASLAGLLAAGSLALLPAPALAEPGPASSAEAAELIAERAHDLEVITEEFNEAREQLAATQRAADDAAAQVAAAQAALDEARDQVRVVAYSIYTGQRLGALEAMLTSDSADEVLDRIGTLQTIAEHNAGVLSAADDATSAADEAQATSARAAADAQSQLEQVTAQRDDLDAQIAEYQAAYDRLSAEEQRASRAAAERHAAEQAASEQTASESAPDAGPAPAAPAPPVAAVAAGGSAAAQTAVNTAMAQIGDPYVWGAAGPNAFDCSGLVQYAYAAAGISLPHSSRMQSQLGTPVSRDQLRPGDLVFFYSPVSHVGIYTGNGQMVHASTAGVPVKTASLDSMGSYNTARRIAG